MASRRRNPSRKASTGGYIGFGFSVIERSIVFDWQNFIVNSIMFD